MPYTKGDPTLNTFLKGPEAHKLHIEFQVDGTIHAGQPVVLHADGDKVSAASATSKGYEIIGVSLNEGYSAYGAYVVVAVRGYAVIEAEAIEAITPGPANYCGYTTREAYTGTHKEFGGRVLTGNAAGSATAQVETVLVAGSAGSSNITLAGLTKLCTFNTDIDTTTDDFRVAHAAAYAAIGITVTDTATQIVYTAAVAGTPFNALDFAVEVVTAGLTITKTATQVNVAAGAVDRIIGWNLDAATYPYQVIRMLIKD